MLIAEKLTTHIQTAHQKRIGNGIGTMLKVKLGSKIQYIVCYNGTGEKRVQKCIRFFCLAVFTCIAPQGFYAEPPTSLNGGGGEICRHC